MLAEKENPALSRLILDADQIAKKIRRIAFEIYERNYQEKQLIVAGIVGQGYHLAQRICKELEAISHFKGIDRSLLLIQVSLKKFEANQSNVSLDCDSQVLENASIILVDDVLNTGKTVAFSLQPFLTAKIKKLETAVLVNRSHKLFPIAADYTGYELATTIQEHIEVVLEENKQAVYLK